MIRLRDCWHKSWLAIVTVVMAWVIVTVAGYQIKMLLLPIERLFATVAGGRYIAAICQVFNHPCYIAGYCHIALPLLLVICYRKLPPPST
jgi:hypothetical protein